MATNLDKLNAKLYDHVHTDEKRFKRAMAIEHACANMGMDNLLDDDDDIEAIHQQLLECHYDAELSNLSSFGRRKMTGSLEAKAEAAAEKAVAEEMKGWLEQAEGDFAKIKEQGLPWTLRSSRIVFGS